MGIIQGLQQEVGKVFGAQFAVDYDARKYSRANIRQWLLNWHEINQYAQRSMVWMRCKADVEAAVESLGPRLVDLFETYCVLGFEQDEVCYIFGWHSQRSFNNSWTLLITGICERLQDNTIRSMGAGRQVSVMGGLVMDDEPRVCTCRK